LLVALALPRVSTGQAGDPKSGFLQALARFSIALDGAFGDEGRTVRQSLDAMARGLDNWDATIQASETALATQLPRAEPALAARMHLALGGAYLDRVRVSDALGEFERARTLDPNRSAVFVFDGLARAQLAGDLDGAVAAFQRAAALDPDNLLDAYLLARALDRRGRTSEAQQAFRTVLRLWTATSQDRTSRSLDTPFIRLGLVQEQSNVEPFFPPVLYAEGFALLQRGEFARALDAFRRAVARDPLAVAAVESTDPAGRAAAAFRDGDMDTATQQLKAALDLAPNRSELHRLLGRVRLLDRHDDEAVKELQRAVELSPDDERAQLDLCDGLVELRRYEDAERALRNAIQTFPSSGRAHYRLARLYQRQNQSIDALRDFEVAAKLHPLLGLNRVLQVIGALDAAQQNFDAAIEAYSNRVDIHPNDAEAHRALGYTYARVERRDEALAEFAIALVLDPGSAETYVAMSQIYLRSGDHAAAADAARRAIARNPANKQARYALATALRRLDRPDEADAELATFDTLQREETAAVSRQMMLNGLRREAAIRSESGDHARAAEALRKALEIAPDDASSHLELGIALLKFGQAKEAIGHLNMAARAQPSLEAHQQLAAAYAALGQTEDSERELTVYRQMRRDLLRRQGDR
jgi:tetratricopeptide (TPR) repeat protein